MDDPKVIAARVAKEANEAVDEAAKVAIEAFDKINSPDEFGEYTAKDAIKSVIDLARIAITGAFDMARIPLQTQPDPRVMLLARPHHDGRPAVVLERWRRLHPRRPT